MSQRCSSTPFGFKAKLFPDVEAARAREAVLRAEGITCFARSWGQRGKLYVSHVHPPFDWLRPRPDVPPLRKDPSE